MSASPSAPGLFSAIKQIALQDPNPTDAQLALFLKPISERVSVPLLNKFKDYIRKNWGTRPERRSLKDLADDVRHECSREYFDKLLGGIHPGTDENAFELDINNKLKEAEEAESPEDKAEIIKATELKISEIAKFFTEGIFIHLQDNFYFNRNGIPIAVREGDDRTGRFPKCHAQLLKDNDIRSKAASIERAAKAAGRRLRIKKTSRHTSNKLRRKTYRKMH